VEKYFERGGSVLDVPCGTGRLWSILLAHGLRVTGGDISQAMLKLARQQFSDHKDVAFHEVDVEKLPFTDNQFDYLTCYRLMAHLPPKVKRAALSEMMRVTRKTAIINYHFASSSPLGLFNRMFRKHAYPAFPQQESELRDEIGKMNCKLCEIRRLSWYERSSALVVIQKNC